MKRKIVYIGSSYIIGIFFASFFSVKIQSFLFFSLLFLFSVFCSIKKIKIVYFLVCALSFFCGTFEYDMYEHFVHDEIIQYSGQTVSFSGKAEEYVSRSGEKSSYVFKGKINGTKNIKLSYYGDDLGCEISDTVFFECEVKEPENTYLFSKKDYYEGKGIFLETYSVKDLKIKENKSFSLKRELKKSSDKVSEEIMKRLPNEYGGFIVSMLLSDKSGLEDDTKTSLYRCGTGHVMAVSGLHLVILISIVTTFLGRISISGKNRFLISELIIGFFVLFSGMSVSVIRAAVMLTLINGAGIFSRKNDPLNSLCLAVIIMLIPAPYLIRSSSFLLSVSGTFGAAVFAPFVLEKAENEHVSDRIFNSMISVLCISAAVFPCSFLFFDEVSVITPVTNLLMMPLCEGALVFGFLAAFAAGFDFLMYPFLMAGGALAKAALFLSDFFGSLSFACIPSGKKYLSVMIVFMILFVFFTAFKSRNGKYTGAAVVLSFILILISGSLEKYLTKDVLTVYRAGKNESCAIVVKYRNNADIIDLRGGRNNVKYLQKLLAREGIRKIGSVTLCDKAYQEMAAYDESLSLFKIGNVYVSDDTYDFDSSEICGCIPKKCDIFDMDYIYGNYRISLDKDEIHVYYKDTDIEISSSSCRANGAEYDYSDVFCISADNRGNIKYENRG